MLMKMKKTKYCFPVVGLLVAALAFVSCHRPDEDSSDVDVAIGMSSSVSNRHFSTRAGIINNLPGFQEQGSFGVFGWKEATNPYSLLIFDNVEVTSYDPDATDTDPAKSAWQYSPIRYWDKSATHYYFGAYAPKLPTTASGVTGPSVAHSGDAASNQAYTINSIPNWQTATTGYDLMVAYDHNTPSYYLTEEKDAGNNIIRQAGYVNLEFSHILSQLVINTRLISAPNEVTYRITKLEIGQNEDGKRVPEGDDATNNTSTYNFSYGSSSQAGSFGAFVPGTATIYSDATGHEVTDPTTLVCTNFAVPFTVTNGIYLTIHYTSTKRGVVTQEPAVTYPLVDESSNNILAFEQGKRYTATILFEKGKVIDLIDVAIAVWQTGGSESHDVFNW